MLRCSSVLHEAGSRPQVWVSKGTLDLFDNFGQEVKNLLDGMITCQGQVSLVRLKEVAHIEGCCGRQGSSAQRFSHGTVGGVT